MTKRQKAWLLVLGSAFAGLLQLVGLAGLRWREARSRFDLTPSDWRTVWAYSSYLGFGDYAGKCAAFETVRAIAAGQPTAFQAADDESLILDMAGRSDLADRVLAHELAPSPWPKGQWLPMSALLRLMRPGREEEERQLALRGAAEFTPSEGLFFYELSIVLLARSGEHAEALGYFDRVRREVPAPKVHRETLAAAAASTRALGNPEAANRLEADAAHAKSHPMLTRQYKSLPTNVVLDAALSVTAATVNPESPSAHWGALLRASALVVLAWLGLPTVLSLLAWTAPPVGEPTRLREVLGALALAMGTLPAVNAYVLYTSSSFEPYVAAPFATIGSTGFWLSALAALLVVMFALRLVEGQSLRDLGWRVSPHQTR